MDFFDIIGYIGTFILGITLAPQVYNTYFINKSADGLSVGYLCLQIFANILFIIYAIHLMSIPILISNCLVFMFSFLLLFAKYWFKNTSYTEIK